MDSCGRLSGKRILLGVTGSIAAYKAVEILRRLQEQGAEVRVALSRNAERFVTRLTFEALSAQAVLSDEFSGSRSTMGHIEITDGLDAALLAPATANVIGKIASGIADDALTTAVMALACPLLIAPAMNDRMYRNPILQKNMRSLRELGVRFIEPGTGALACGSLGQGRLADVDTIVREVAAILQPRDLAGKTVLVTAGPTQEAIDAVRFISNPSTGKMGYALAEAARDRGAEVILITGPTQLAAPSEVTLVRVVSAADMQRAVREHSPRCHAVIMAAAVSDFRPVQQAARKVKKEDASLTVELERTADILRELGSTRRKQVLVGFSAETDDVEQNALKKLKDKNLDLIIANDLRKPGSGFGTDTNAVTIFDRAGSRTELATLPKQEIASRIMEVVAGLLARQPF